jgi:hypothetical protein
MELWVILIVIGIILLGIYLFRKKDEHLKTKKEYPVYDEIYKDIDIRINGILNQILEANNYPYPIKYNPSNRPEIVTDETEDSKQISNIIKYLEMRFNSYDKNYQLKIDNVKKLIKYNTDKQIKYQTILGSIINIVDNQKIKPYAMDIMMEIIISKYFDNNNVNYDMYISKLNINEFNNSQHILGIEKDQNKEHINTKQVLNKKREMNQVEMGGLNANFDPIYPQTSSYQSEVGNKLFNVEPLGDYIEKFTGNTESESRISNYASCDPNEVHTEDVLDIFN